MATQRRADIGVDPEWILNPAYRKYFGKEGEKVYNSYGLLLRVMANFFYRNEIREILRADGKTANRRPTKQIIRINDWRKNFKAAIHDLVKGGQRMLSLNSLPGPEDELEDNVISINQSGKERLRRYRDEEVRMMPVLFKLMESHLDELWGQVKSE